MTDFELLASGITEQEVQNWRWFCRIAKAMFWLVELGCIVLLIECWPWRTR